MKRFICLCVLVASCLCFLLPEKAWAAETSGTCGKKATWSLDETTGTLTISGAGVMELDLLYPWPDIKNVVTRIVIEEGITGLCDKAFVDFTEVTDPTTEPTQTPAQPTIEPTQPAPTSSNDNQSTWIIIVVSVLIIAGGGAAGFTFSKKSK